MRCWPRCAPARDARDGGLQTCRARGAYERADLVRILVAGRALDAGGDVDAGRPGDAQRLRHVLRIEPAGKHERHRGIEVLEQVPVEALAEPARPGRIARRARVEQQAVGDLVIEPDRRKVGAFRDRQRLGHRQAEAGAHHHDAFRAFLAVQLQHVGRERLDAGGKLVVGGVDRQRDLLRPAAHALAQHARGSRIRHGAARPERTRSRPCRRRLRARRRAPPASQSADLDQNGHVPHDPSRGSSSARGPGPCIVSTLPINWRSRSRRRRRNGQPRRVVHRRRRRRKARPRPCAA